MVQGHNSRSRSGNEVEGVLRPRDTVLNHESVHCEAINDDKHLFHAIVWSARHRERDFVRVTDGCRQCLRDLLGCHQDSVVASSGCEDATPRVVATADHNDVALPTSRVGHRLVRVRDRDTFERARERQVSGRLSGDGVEEQRKIARLHAVVELDFSQRICGAEIQFEPLEPDGSGIIRIEQLQHLGQHRVHVDVQCLHAVVRSSCSVKVQHVVGPDFSGHVLRQPTIALFTIVVVALRSFQTAPG
mmetsp:Transcript_25684/g.37843  ORF Transcript_25684/g.37843 Transcript_25684/m.37843 type:complete len:246 (-) Transcript_25684:6440-7177(-)